MKAISSESHGSVFKSAGLHNRSPPVNTSDSRQMNGQRGGLGSWGWGGVGFWDQCSLIGRRINQSSPWGAVESNGERLKCFVWVSPMAWPRWLSVSHRELYLLRLQALYCRTLFKSRRNPYTPLHEYCRSLLSRTITTDPDKCSLTVISLVDSLKMLFFQRHLVCLCAGA